MDTKYNASLISAARMLRKNMTKEERHLWYDFLRSYPVRFQRQRIFGNYITDFYCASARLVIELDGSQHYDTAGIAYDAQRTAYLESCGLTVVRIPNNDVTGNFRGVCEYIDQLVQSRAAAKKPPLAKAAPAGACRAQPPGGRLLARS